MRSVSPFDGNKTAVKCRGLFNYPFSMKVLLCLEASCGKMD